ncbi:hypothetical protein D3C72_2109910 [compost metagenome]
MRPPGRLIGSPFTPLRLGQGGIEVCGLAFCWLDREEVTDSRLAVLDAVEHPAQRGDFLRKDLVQALVEVSAEVLFGHALLGECVNQGADTVSKWQAGVAGQRLPALEDRCFDQIGR